MLVLLAIVIWYTPTLMVHPHASGTNATDHY